MSAARGTRRGLPPGAPIAARVGDEHVCSHVERGAPHVGGPIVKPGAETVLIGGEPAARVGDRCVCLGGEYDVINDGEPTILIGGRPAARKGDSTGGGVIVEGDDTVQLGSARRMGRDPRGAHRGGSERRRGAGQEKRPVR